MPAPSPFESSNGHRRVYLDNHATTPVDPRVLEAMLPYFGAKFGNASSRNHSFGWEAGAAVEKARKQVAELAGASPREIIFTSGATESNNLALKGAVEAYRSGNDHVVTVASEHRSVLDAARRLEQVGVRVTILPVQSDGLVDLQLLQEAIRSETLLVSVMYANNEIGVIQPVRQIGALCRERGVVFHCDATQAAGKIPVDVQADHIDLMSISAHKIYGPKGIGALYVRRSPHVTLRAQMEGGGQEFGVRPGTLNVPAIAGLGEACRICRSEMADEALRLGALRDSLVVRLRGELEGVSVHGSMSSRLPGNLNLSFAGVDSEVLLASLPDVALSTGSACTSATVEPSHVLAALGLDEGRLHSAVRIGIGRFNTAEEIDYSAERLVEAVTDCRRAGTLTDACG